MIIRISTHQKIIDIISLLPQLLDQLVDDERYSTILNFLSKWYKNHSEEKLPAIKEIQLKTNLSYTKLRKRVDEIHELIFREDKVSLEFCDSEIVFYASFLGAFTQIKMNELTHLPRIGENITLPFLKGKIGTDWYYVEDVRHVFHGRKQTIEIMLKPGSFNSYWHFRRHKAFELGEVSPMDQIYLNDYQLKKILNR